MRELTEREKVAHLLRRFGLGASEAEIDYYGAEGMKAAIEKLLDYEAVDEGFPIVLQDFANNNGNVNIIGLQMWWYLRLLATRRPLEQKLTVFWHDHFATSAAKVDVTPPMYDHIETLRQNASGKFLDLLTAVSTDQAMLYWLDNNQNVSGSPNENFAREVMELFTLGVDNGYTEKDVQEAARAFTGWTFGVGRGGRFRQTQKPNRGSRFFNVARRHDSGNKTVLGRTGNFDGNDVLRILCQEKRTAVYITTKMWEWFAYEAPSHALIERLSASWTKSGLDTKVLVRAIMESEEFYSEKSYRQMVKNPVDFCVAPLRALGVGRPIIERMEAAEGRGKRRAAGMSRLLSLKCKSMGMDLLFPPDVDGWVSGTEWISTSTMVERIKFADLVFGGRSRGMAAMVAQGLGAQAAQPDAVVDRLLSIFDAELPPDKVRLLKESAVRTAGETIGRQALQPVLLATTRLIFGSPEFQFS